MKTKSEKMDALIKKNKGIFVPFLEKKRIKLGSPYKLKTEQGTLKFKVCEINYLDMKIGLINDDGFIVHLSKDEI